MFNPALPDDVMNDGAPCPRPLALPLCALSHPLTYYAGLFLQSLPLRYMQGPTAVIGWLWITLTLSRTDVPTAFLDRAYDFLKDLGGAPFKLTTRIIGVAERGDKSDEERSLDGSGDSDSGSSFFADDDAGISEEARDGLECFLAANGVGVVRARQAAWGQRHRAEPYDDPEDSDD